jgi:hypothetical protein
MNLSNNEGQYKGSDSEAVADDSKSAGICY